MLVYFQLSRPSARQARAELYAALEMMEDVLDHDLDARERDEIESRLRYVVTQKDQPELAHLAEELLGYVKDEQIYIAPPPPDFLKRLEAKLLAFEGRHFNRTRFRAVLALGLSAVGVISLFNTIHLMAYNLGPGLLGLPFTFVIEAVSDPSFAYILWFFTLQVVQAVFGLVLIAGAVMLVIGRERQGIRVSYIALLVYLTMVNLLLFYYNQFSTIVSAVFQFVLLLAVLYYRQRHLS